MEGWMDGKKEGGYVLWHGWRDGWKEGRKEGGYVLWHLYPVSGIVETKSEWASNQSILKTKLMSRERERERDTKIRDAFLVFQLGLTGGQDYWPDLGGPSPLPTQTGNWCACCQYVIYLLTICTRTTTERNYVCPPNGTMKNTKGNLQRKRDINFYF